MAGKITAAQMGVNAQSGDDTELFKWFLASFLFGKRISQKIAADSYRVIVEQHGRDTPQKIANCSWQELVDMLGEGHYRRYDESTASRLLDLAHKLIDEYGGSMRRVHEGAGSKAELQRRLCAFKGVGPKTAEIYLREVPVQP